jgi:hypothetical protein
LLSRFDRVYSGYITQGCAGGGLAVAMSLRARCFFFPTHHQPNANTVMSQPHHQQPTTAGTTTRLNANLQKEKTVCAFTNQDLQQRRPTVLSQSRLRETHCPPPTHSIPPTALRRGGLAVLDGDVARAPSERKVLIPGKSSLVVWVLGVPVWLLLAPWPRASYLRWPPVRLPMPLHRQHLDLHVVSCLGLAMSLLCEQQAHGLVAGF